MSDEYDNWRKYEDAKAFKNKLAEIDRLKDRIETLEAALHCISLGSQDSGTTKEGLGREARKTLEGKDG